MVGTPRILARLCAACALLAGCGGASPPPATPEAELSPAATESGPTAEDAAEEEGTVVAEGKMTDVPGDASGEIVPECSDKDDCNNRGVFAAMAGQGPVAAALLQKACDMGSGSGCSNLANLIARGQLLDRDLGKAAGLDVKACDLGEPKGCVNAALAYFEGTGVGADPARARELFSRGCDLGHLESCKNIGVLHWEGKGGPQDHAKAVTFFKKACDGGDASGCFNMGVAHYKGLGAARDDQKAREYFDTACLKGDKGGCDLRDELDEGASKGGGVPGANLTVGSMTADGMTVKDLECALGSMGFMAALQLVGSIAANKKALDRCAPKGDAVRVTWEMAGGKTKNVEASGAKPKVARCVKLAAGKISSPLSGKCSAVFLVGKEAGANAAYEKLGR